jgi:hypothetical protein
MCVISAALLREFLNESENGNISESLNPPKLVFPATIMSFVTAVAKPQPSDVEVSQPPSDSITALAFSPTADLLAVASWDENVKPIVQNSRVNGNLS